VGDQRQDGSPARFGDGPQRVVYEHRPHGADHEPSSNQATSASIERPSRSWDPANVEFYERFGFQVVDANLALVPGGPTHTAMRRQARR
jgi:hypothetical protein